MNNDNEDKQPDRPPAIGTYDTNAFLTDREKHTEGKRAFDSEQDAETDDSGDE